MVDELRHQHNKPVDFLIVDPDVVEGGNISRSSFCAAEVGSFKAQTLAERITFTWGIETAFSCENFDPEKHLKRSASD